MKVIEDVEHLGSYADCSDSVGSDVGVKGPVENAFGDVEEGEAAQEWHSWRAGGLLSSPQQDKDGKEKEEDEKKNELHQSTACLL